MFGPRVERHGEEFRVSLLRGAGGAVQEEMPPLRGLSALRDQEDHVVI